VIPHVKRTKKYGTDDFAEFAFRGPLMTQLQQLGAKTCAGQAWLGDSFSA